MKKVLLLSLIAAMAAFTGCSKDDNGNDGGGTKDLIQLTSTGQTLSIGDNFQIQATSISKITYASENSLCAEVSSTGLVTAKNVGTTNIILTNKDDNKKLKITVKDSGINPNPPDLIHITSADQILYYGDEFQVEATSNSAITYTSENEYHATVSSSGLITAKRIGVTNIVLTNGSDTKKLKITVKPESTLYPEPDISFGTTRAAIKAKFGTPANETSAAILYNNYSTNAPQIIYLFDDSEKLSSYSIMVKTAYSSELGKFLGERYVLADVDDNNYSLLYVNGIDKNTISMGVGASLYNSTYWMVVYFPYTLTRSRSIESHREIINMIDEIIKLK